MHNLMLQYDQCTEMLGKFYSYIIFSVMTSILSFLNQSAAGNAIQHLKKRRDQSAMGTNKSVAVQDWYNMYLHVDLEDNY